MMPRLENFLCVAGVKPGRLAVAAKWRRCVIFLLGLFPFLTLSECAFADSVPVLTTIREVHQLAEPDKAVACSVLLQGVVLWISSDRDQFIFQDDSGGLRVEMELRSQPELHAGEAIVLEGRGLTGPDGFREALINSDGLHPVIEKSEAIFLNAGRHPIRVDWYNALNLFEFNLSWEGPGVSRERIPGAALFRLEKQADGTTNWVNGLDYRGYEGNWQHVPDFEELPILKSGSATNFDLSVRTRDDNVGLQFSGFLEVPNSGLYRFWSRSDDGSRLYVDDVSLRIRGTGVGHLPVPQQIFAGQPLAEDEDCRWSEMKGTITFIGERAGAMDLELNSGTGLIHLEVEDASGICPRLLLNSQVRVTGISQSMLTIDNQRIAGALLVPGVKQIEVLEPASALWNECPLLSVSELVNTNFSDARDSLVHVRGMVSASESSNSFFIADKAGQILVETVQALPAAGGEVELLGQWARAGTNVVLRCSFYRAATGLAEGSTPALPLLTRIEQVKSLSREEAQKGYPVKIRGVVTAPIAGGFFIQDATWAIFARWDGLTLSDMPQVGDLWDMDGVTYAEFSPNIQVQHMVRLATGVLPAPLHPTLDRLVNGSMDTRYVEIQGIVTGIEPDGIQLLTHEGRVKVRLTDVDPNGSGPPHESDLKRYENALIRIRGCVIPAHNDQTHQFKVGYFWLCNFSITVDQPAPSDLFSAPRKSIADLRKFDSHASTLQRIKVAGQILHQRGEEFFLWDGTDGFRFVPVAPVHLQTGDMVEVVGFPDLSGPSPMLREGLVQRTGHANLPTPRSLAGKVLLSRDYDSSLVRIQARLTDISTEASDQILTLQTEAHGFVARLNTRQELREDLLPGSRLELTGVYVGQGGDPASDVDIASFELLLNSPADITVLERASWWTLRRLLVATGVIALVLVGAMLWVFTLRRRVNAQTIVIHQKVEREATLEERARIARDIHDTLEQALAGTSFQLNALASSLNDAPQEPVRILNVARSMIRHAQEEARRTVRNLRLLDLEKRDLPTALARLAVQAGVDSPVEIKVQVKGTAKAFQSHVESHLLRISQEAITNAIKHARAKTIQVELSYETDLLQLMIRDEGCGFDVAHAASTTAGHFGLLGMRERSEKIGGTLQIQSTPGQGTTIQVKVPLAGAALNKGLFNTLSIKRNAHEK